MPDSATKTSGHPPPKLSVLHLDDDPFELERVQVALEKNAIECTYAVTSVPTVAEYQGRLAKEPKPDIVILDIHIDDGTVNGIALAEATRRDVPGTVILMCSTADDVATIADCLNAGADDFLSKQSDRGELSLRVFNSYRLAKLKHGSSDQSDRTNAGRADPVGATMDRVAKRVPLIINSAISAIFLRGESGTGKEVVADLFGATLAPGTPFIKVNCGAIAPTLLESELFGHVKGAFTGAAADKRGLFEAASGGFIFLDEVATLSPSAQVALLRVLENQEVLRVGSTKPVAINVRVLSATNEPMEQLVKLGRFRADLWQRLRETEIVLPPLRERANEIPALVHHFARAMAGGPYTVSGPVMEVLSNFPWKEGNVRELRNCLRAMTEMHVNKLLTPLAIPERIWDELGDKPASDVPAVPATANPPVAASRPKGGEITLAFDPLALSNFDLLTDQLLLEMTRRVAAARGKVSLRSLSQHIGMSRSTLSGRIKGIVHRNLASMEEMARLVGIGDKGGEG